MRKPQKALNSLKILYYLSLSALSVFSVAKNFCSVVLNLFQNLVSRKARKDKHTPVIGKADGIPS